MPNTLAYWSHSQATQKMKSCEYAPWSYCLRVRPGAYPRVEQHDLSIFQQFKFIGSTFFYQFNIFSSLQHFVHLTTCTSSVYLHQLYFNCPNFFTTLTFFTLPRQSQVEHFLSFHQVRFVYVPSTESRSLISAYSTLIFIF